MTQTPLQRRLVRLAQVINLKAEKLRAYGRVNAMDLAIIIRDHPRCAYCGIGLDPGGGTFDHVVPFDRNGRNTPDNIVRSCYSCNRRKFTKSPEELSEYVQTVVECPICGTEFRPRWSQLKSGNGRFCSRRCSAASRWVGR